MASKCLSLSFLIPLLAVAAPLTALAGDPDIVSDFLLPQNLTASNITGAFFTFTGMRQIMNANEPTTFTVLKATAAEFPALDGQSVSSAVLIYPPSSVNPPHTHPRSAELLFLIVGALDVGFVDTTNKLYTQTLQPGTCLCSRKDWCISSTTGERVGVGGIGFRKCECWDCLGPCRRVRHRH
uniref:Cupin type-1 domain-containing protein n=1 Tax=Ananas comosus var. bracteatus TaxID=296719 RepID=A0A6V7NH52_ANACO|nr:unnamed protein product [Ananas comosus var. bracteatus]